MNLPNHFDLIATDGRARTGRMRDIVATIQGEQDTIIRAPLETCLVVQGGPGTGKTAVGLHRAAFLMYEHRARLARGGVLVVGPNPVPKSMRVSPALAAVVLYPREVPVGPTIS